MPYLAGYRLKKIFDRVPIKYQMCANKLMNGKNLDSTAKTLMSHNISCIKVRCKGGLMLRSRIVIIIVGLIIKLFKLLINSEIMTND